MAGAIMDKIWGVIGMNNNNQSEAEDLDEEDYDLDTYDNNYDEEEGNRRSAGRRAGSIYAWLRKQAGRGEHSGSRGD